MQMIIWMIRPLPCSSIPLQMVIRKEEGPDDQHFFGLCFLQQIRTVKTKTRIQIRDLHCLLGLVWWIFGPVELQACLRCPDVSASFPGKIVKSASQIATQFVELSVNFFCSESFCILISHLHHLVTRQQLGVILKTGFLENGTRCIG